MRFIILALAFISIAFNALAGGADAEQRSGKGWVTFNPISMSPDYAFLRRFIEQSDDYARSLEYSPWNIDDLKVGYYDVNDDGREEMFLSIAEASSYYCGTGGCDIFLFEKRDGQWREIEHFHHFDIWVSDEKIMGYHTLYSSRGYRFRWRGAEYGGDCPEKVPEDLGPDIDIRCYRSE